MADVAFDHDVYEREGYYTLKFATREGVDRYWGFRWRHVLRTIVRVAHPETVLDVGAGNGYFVCLAREEFGLRAAGVEISRREVRFAAEVLGVELLEQDLAEHAVRDYSLVTLFNVLEHVPDPLGFLREAAAHVGPDGYLAVTTPNPACLHARLKGLRHWRLIEPPHHINLFSRRGLEAILARIGFRPVHYETLSAHMEWLWRYDTRRQPLRHGVSALLRLGGLGGDHFLLARRAPGA
jgi:2-polyprenyl-3-methyl-5-hydroxy-6-metoxy-1,4-benzoquinol methylase